MSTLNTSSLDTQLFEEFNTCKKRPLPTKQADRASGQVRGVRVGRNSAAMRRISACASPKLSAMALASVSSLGARCLHACSPLAAAQVALNARHPISSLLVAICTSMLIPITLMVIHIDDQTLIM